MSGKGIVGEELFASVLIVVLTFIFIISLHGFYSNYLSKQSQVESDRIASSISEKIFFETGGRINDCGYLDNYGLNNICVEIENCNDCSNFLRNLNKVSSSSMPILLGGEPTRLIVYVKV